MTDEAATPRRTYRYGWLLATAAEADKVLQADRLPSVYLLSNLEDGRALVRRITGTERLTIGRAEQPVGGLSVPWDATCSGTHAVLDCTAGVLLAVEDAGSRNGTYVNGARTDGRTSLGDRDLLRVGTTEIIVRCPAGVDGGTVALPPVPDWTVLTKRERECLLTFADLWPAELRLQTKPPTTQTIGDALGIGRETVRTHLQATRAKLGDLGIEVDGMNGLADLATIHRSTLEAAHQA